MMIFEDISPGPARRLLGYRCDRCGRELLFGNTVVAEELAEMSVERLDADAYGVGRQHVCRACRTKAGLKITGVPENPKEAELAAARGNAPLTDDCMTCDLIAGSPECLDPRTPWRACAQQG
jgi:hypothetical protein